LKPFQKKFLLFLVAVAFAASIRQAPAKEFLTPDEIVKIQDAQEIDLRVKIYLQAAALRLKTVADRFAGKESAQGDPLEFFTVEDMLEGYYQILRAVMLNLDDASRKPGVDPAKIHAALKGLKAATDAAANQLEALKKTAEAKQREEAWNLIVKAIEINKGAQEGAATALKK